MVKVEFRDDGLEIDMEGIEKVAAIKGKLQIPYGHISSVMESADQVWPTLRLGGTSLGPDRYDYGRFETNDGYGFFAMKDRKKAFAIFLVEERFKVLVLQVENNEEVIGELRRRISGSALRA